MTLSSRLLRRVPEPKESYPVAAEVETPQAEPIEEPQVSDPDESAVAQAYRKGYEEGYAACAKAAESEVTKQVAAFRAMVDELASQRKRLIRESEQAVLKLSCEIARKIIGRAAEIKENLIEEVVKNAVGHLAERQRMVIRVNPLDLEILERNQPEWIASDEGIELKADKRIKRGGCLVEGESGSVDAQIESQIDAIEKALMRAAR